MASTLRVEHGPVRWPAIVVHGGAGTYSRLCEGGDTADVLAAELGHALAASLDAGWAALVGGSGPVAAVVAAVAYLENTGAFNAGRGSVPTTAGTVEMDAAAMDDSGRAGAVACIQWHSPIRAAEAVLRRGGPVLMAGPNADAFAASAGVPLLDAVGAARAENDEGTVGAVAVSADGRVAAASSTGGRAGQLPGRVGDTPVPGAGLWAQPGCAVSVTGIGEAILLAGFSRLVANRQAAGHALTAALEAGLEEVERYGGVGGGIALSGDGTWAAAFTTKAMARGVRHVDGQEVIVVD
jgi:isoaspartyl peptidase/L-asparaginase-like protein (Ntn-hydrolase superfamily)